MSNMRISVQIQLKLSVRRQQQKFDMIEERKIYKLSLSWKLIILKFLSKKGMIKANTSSLNLLLFVGVKVSINTRYPVDGKRCC